VASEIGVSVAKSCAKKSAKFAMNRSFQMRRKFMEPAAIWREAIHRLRWRNVDPETETPVVKDFIIISSKEEFCVGINGAKLGKASKELMCHLGGSPYYSVMKAGTMKIFVVDNGQGMDRKVNGMSSVFTTCSPPARTVLVVTNEGRMFRVLGILRPVSTGDACRNGAIAAKCSGGHR